MNTIREIDWVILGFTAIGVLPALGAAAAALRDKLLDFLAPPSDVLARDKRIEQSLQSIQEAVKGTFGGGAGTNKPA